jgi:hypothetical protein
MNLRSLIDHCFGFFICLSEPHLSVCYCVVLHAVDMFVILVNFIEGLLGFLSFWVLGGHSVMLLSISLFRG